MEDMMVTYKKVDGIALVTFNRPEALNALNTAVNRRLFEVLTEVENDEDIRVIVLTGAGEKAFVAGADIKEMSTLDPLGAKEFALVSKRALDKIWNMDLPVIAAINGFCLGGGLEYAMCCDIRIASDDAKFGLPEITLGILPGGGGTQRLPRLIGFGKAKELCLTGSVFGAAEALRLGLVNHVYPKERMLDETMNLAGRIARHSRASVSLIKSSMNKGFETDLDTASCFELNCFALCFSTAEQKERMKSFIEKKKG